MIWLGKAVRNDMAEEGGSELRGWGRRFGMTWLGKVVWNDMAGESSNEMTLLSGEVSLDARGCVA